MKISFVYDAASEVPEATSHDVTYEPVSCHGQINYSLFFIYLNNSQNHTHSQNYAAENDSFSPLLSLL